MAAVATFSGRLLRVTENSESLRLPSRFFSASWNWRNGGDPVSGGDWARQGAVWARRAARTPRLRNNNCWPCAYCIGEVRERKMAGRLRQTQLKRPCRVSQDVLHSESCERNATPDASDRRRHHGGGAWGCGVVRGTSAQRGDADAPL